MHIYYASQVPYPAVTEQGTIINIDPSLSTTARKSSQAVVMLREAVAWALLSLMTLLFIGIFSAVTILLCVKKQRQRRDSTVTADSAPVYEMDGNPCYESSKMDTTYGANIYEQIELN